MTTASCCASCVDSSITSACTVDAAIAKSRASFAVLNSFGIDTCCGGDRTLADAAAHAHVNTSALIGALEAAQQGQVLSPLPLRPPAPACSCGCR